MEEYRKFITRGECLISALLQTLILALQFGAFLFTFHELNWGGLGLFALLILLQLIGFTFHWRRYLMYGKRERSNL